VTTRRVVKIHMVIPQYNQLTGVGMTYGATDDFGWKSNWGMAASAAKKVYVHVLVVKLG